jgi:biotin carboxylase
MQSRSKENTVFENKPVIAIVDGYRIGSFFAPHAKKYGYSCIHIQSSPEIPSSLLDSFHAEDYLATFLYDNNLDKLLEHLCKYSILCCIPGSEIGVVLADTLGEKLGLPNSNGTKLSEARRNKFKMIEAIKCAGLRSVEHICSDALDDIINWVRKMNRWPIVVKPVDAAGTEGVTFCHNERDVEAAFHKVRSFKKFSVCGRNDVVLAQTYLLGKEYVVNTVSLGGKHYIANFWVYNKKIIPGAGAVYDYYKLLPYDFEYREELSSYAFKVLDALGIKYGAAHSEIFLTKEGPVLMETAARIMGVVTPELSNAAMGRNQLDLTLESYINPERFLQISSKPYVIAKNFLGKNLISYVAGVIKNIHFLDEIKKLPSFYNINLSVTIGSAIHKTTDLFTSPGYINLLHENDDVVMADYEKIVRFEQEMFEV